MLNRLEATPGIDGTQGFNPGICSRDNHINTGIDTLQNGFYQLSVQKRGIACRYE